MKVGDIVKLIDKYALDSFKGHCGVISATDERLRVTSHCVEVVFPLNTGNYRISMLELVSATR
jgi:hypothetical protein